MANNKKKFITIHKQNFTNKEGEKVNFYTGSFFDGYNVTLCTVANQCVDDENILNTCIEVQDVLFGLTVPNKRPKIRMIIW